MGKRSFPNKRILRNNLCLPASKILIYKGLKIIFEKSWNKNILTDNRKIMTLNI